MTTIKKAMALTMFLSALLTQGCAQYEKAPAAAETQRTETRGITGLDEEAHEVAPPLQSQEER